MNIGLQALDVQLIALLLVEHGNGTSLSIVGLSPCILEILACAFQLGTALDALRSPLRASHTHVECGAIAGRHRHHKVLHQLHQALDEDSLSTAASCHFPLQEILFHFVVEPVDA